MQHLAELADAALPVHEGAGTVGDRRDREHDIGGTGHLGGTHLQRYDEAGRLDGRACESRVVEVGRVDATDDQSAELAGRRSSDDGVAVAADGLGEVLDTPGGGQVDPGGSVGDRTATGQQVGQRTRFHGSAVTRATRHPGDPCTGGAGQSGHGGESAGRGRGALTHEQQGVLVERDVVVMGEGVERGSLLARTGRDQRAGHLVQAA